jgi:hypothetical protein
MDTVLDADRQIDPAVFANVRGSQIVDTQFVDQIKSSGFLAALEASQGGA